MHGYYINSPVNIKASYRYSLFAIRTTLISLTAFLLVAPLVQSTIYNPQKPLVLVLQDNSQSIKLFGSKALPSGHDLHKALSSLKTQLGNKYDVREFNFSNSIKTGLSSSFSGKQTDIAKALRMANEQFVNQNIGAIILATDGIYNQGSDPLYEAKKIKAGIYTIAMGDTIPKRDLLVGNVNYNKTAFLGNDFETELVVEAYPGQR